MKSTKVKCLPYLPAEKTEKVLFRRACDEVLLQERKDGGIGTLGEKMLHQTVKRYLCPNPDYFEVGIPDTRFVADVKIGNLIFEVQTGPFYPMKKKIDYYLNHTDCQVTVVHPIPYVRWMSKINPKTREISKRRRVSGGREVLLPELYSLLPYLQNPGLQFKLLYLEVQDYRLDKAKKRRGECLKFERIPLALLGEKNYAAPSDYAEFLPDSLPCVFTVKEFSQATGIRGMDAYSSVRVLCALGLIRQIETEKRPMKFERV